MKRPKPQTKSTIAMFKQLKREQVKNVKLLMKVVPRMIAARAQMTSRERQKLEEKIHHCKDRVRFCYWLYTDAVSLLGPKPKWLATQRGFDRSPAR
jgi:hypothetical protein